MLISSPVDFTFRGAPAQMFVLRNDGFCWGRIVVPGQEQQFDVHDPDDGNGELYEYPDADASDAFIEAANNDENVSPAIRPI